VTRSFRTAAAFAALAVTAGVTVSYPGTPGAAAAAAPRPRTAAGVLAQMSTAQRVGQLFMVGTPATSASSSTLSEIRRYHVANVMLTGRSYHGARIPTRVAAAMQSRATTSATDGVKLLIATDQEGGLVQVLQGHGFSTMPSALGQGSWSTAHLRSAATTWGRQLSAAGVNMNLAPVLDTVPSAAAAKHNPPIGAYRREFGYTTSRVGSHGTAFATGMRTAHVAVAVKHFPGLGRVRANTDTSSGVTDHVTRRHDPYLAPFRQAIRADVPFVMMSTAYYAKLDAANPAAFSSFIMRTVLRGDLGFKNAIISDSLADTPQVARWSVGSRATKFIDAGGDVVLTTNPARLPVMYRAVMAKLTSDPVFRARVDAAALHVLQVKERKGLLGH
jgi:beta-N-acetylhexosaminidase